MSREEDIPSFRLEEVWLIDADREVMLVEARLDDFDVIEVVRLVLEGRPADGTLLLPLALK